MKVYLETDRLRLRDWQAEDRKDFARMNADPVIMEFLPRVLSEKDSHHLADKFEKHFEKYGYGLFAVEEKESGEFMGFVGLNNVDFKAPFTPAVEIAWRLDYPFWGKGYGSEAARAVLDYAFTELELDKIVAFTVPDNDRSQAIIEKIGLQRVEGGEFYYPKLPKDHPAAYQILYALERSDYLK